MRQVIKVLEIDPTERPEEVEANIAVLWESMITDDKVKPAVVGIHRLTMGLVAFVFDYSVNGGVTVLEPPPRIKAPPGGGSRKDKYLLGYQDETGARACVQCGEPASEHACPEVKP